MHQNRLRLGFTPYPAGWPVVSYARPTVGTTPLHTSSQWTLFVPQCRIDRHGYVLLQDSDIIVRLTRDVWHLGEVAEPYDADDRCREVQVVRQGRIQGVSRVSGHPPFWLGCPFWKEHIFETRHIWKDKMPGNCSMSQWMNDRSRVEQNF